MKYRIFEIDRGHLDYPTGLHVYTYNSKVDDGFTSFEQAVEFLEKALNDNSSLNKKEYTILPVWAMPVLER